MSWIVASIVLSLVLTVVLNVGLRLFSGPASRRMTSAMSEPEWPAPGEPRSTNTGVRVWAPWKGMLVASLVLTVVVNLVLWIL